MEKYMTIQKVLPTVERPYTDKSGNAQVFTSKGFVLTDGIDTVYAEILNRCSTDAEDVNYEEVEIKIIKYSQLWALTFD